MAVPVERRVSVAEYLAAERASVDTKHEYVDGVVVAMAAGGTRWHALLAMRFGIALGPALSARGCEVYGSDLRVRIPSENVITYPDLTVVCGSFAADDEDPDAATNPVAIVEVLSRTTEAWDRGEKFALYRKLASLRHYVLVSQDCQRVEHYVRGDDGWRLEEVGPGGSVALLGAEVRLDDLYARTDVPVRPARLRPA